MFSLFLRRLFVLSQCFLFLFPFILFFAISILFFFSNFLLFIYHFSFFFPYFHFFDPFFFSFHLFRHVPALLSILLLFNSLILAFYFFSFLSCLWGEMGIWKSSWCHYTKSKPFQYSNHWLENRFSFFHDYFFNFFNFFQLYIEKKNALRRFEYSYNNFHSFVRIWKLRSCWWWCCCSLLSNCCYKTHRRNPVNSPFLSLIKACYCWYHSFLIIITKQTKKNRIKSFFILILFFCCWKNINLRKYPFFYWQIIRGGMYEINRGAGREGKGGGE